MLKSGLTVEVVGFVTFYDPADERADLLFSIWTSATALLSRDLQPEPSVYRTSKSCADESPY